MSKRLGESVDKEHRTALAPHAAHYNAIVTWVWGATDRELTAARRAAEAVSTSNCGWDEYGAARLMLPEIIAEQTRRSRGEAVA